MRRALSLVVLFLAFSLPAGAAESVATTEVPMYAVERWVVSVRGSLDQALADFQPADALVETGDPDAPYLRLVRVVEVICGFDKPAGFGSPWLVEMHATRESAQARADWFPWESWIAKAPDGTWLLTYRNPDLLP
jgi:hypothetical protein